jgi:hypothetical protein
VTPIIHPFIDPFIHPSSTAYNSIEGTYLPAVVDMFCWRSSSGDIVEKSPVSYRRASIGEEKPREATNERERRCTALR